MTKKIFCEILGSAMKLYKIPIQTIVPVTNFQSRLRDEKLSYRYYPSWSTHTIVLFHGLVSSSIYLSALAHRLAERKIAQVILPDLRGHGEDQRNLKWEKNHDVIQDFEEMMIHFKSRTAVERISFMGHSFGARWMKKIMRDAPPSFRVDHHYMIAPFLEDQQVKSGWLVMEGDIGNESLKSTDGSTDERCTDGSTQSKNAFYKVNWPDGVRTGREVFEYPKEFLDMFAMSEKGENGSNAGRNINESLPNGSEKIESNQLQNRNQTSQLHMLPNGSSSLIEAGQDETLSAVSEPERRLFTSQVTFPEVTHMGIVIEKNSIEKVCDLVEKNIL